MKFLMDTQQDTLRKRMAESDLISGQLLTPLTGYANWGGQFAIDNGAFSGFDRVKFAKCLNRNLKHNEQCLFVAVMDIVGSARRTLELFHARYEIMPELTGWPLAFVAQDGAEDIDIPWAEIAAVFIGGKDPWKDSHAAMDIVKTAKIMEKHTHVGRVNTVSRFRRFDEIGADTCDGSGVAMYDHMLQRIESKLTERGLFDGHAEPG
jgi:hypothetical protein